jgi:Tol biopolymer transport system component
VIAIGVVVLLHVISGSAPAGVDASPRDDRFPRWAPDGRRIALVHGRTINGPFRLRIGGLAGRSLRDLGPSLPSPATWSPDGRHIAFVRGDPNGDNSLVVALVRTERSNAVPLANFRGVREPAWAPRGDFIAVLARRHNDPFDHTTLLLARPNGQGARVLLRSTAVRSDPIWSPDGRTILIGLGNARQSIYSIDVRRGTRRPLVPDASGPSFSPDGKTIAYGNHSDLGLYLMNGLGKHKRRLVADGYSPTWSPDGQRVAFIRNDDEASLFVIDRSGRHLRRLRRFSGCLNDLAWSPTGDTIAFTRFVPCESHYVGPGRIWLVKDDGTSLRRLID